MRAFDKIWKVFFKLADRIAMSLRLSHFIGGDCGRNERCILSTGNECIAKEMQIDRDDEHWRRPPNIYPAVF
jgi:hypothetical protein